MSLDTSTLNYIYSRVKRMDFSYVSESGNVDVDEQMRIY